MSCTRTTLAGGCRTLPRQARLPGCGRWFQFAAQGRCVSLAGVYAELSGGSWDRVPEVVRRVHEPGRVSGTFRIERGLGLLARLLAWLARFPPAGECVAIVLQVERTDRGLLWRRTLGEHLMVTEQEICGPMLMCEAAGAVSLTFRVRAGREGLHYEQRFASVRLGSRRLRLPRWLALQVVASCTAEGAGCAFVKVEVRAPLCGLVLRYQGDVAPCDMTPREVISSEATPRPIGSDT